MNRYIPLCLLLLVSAWLFARSEPNQESDSPSIYRMAEPRPPIYRTFSLGSESSQDLSECFIVIAWQHPRSGTDETGYQVWGDDRLLSKSQLSATLEHLCATSGNWPYPPHLLVIGNQWGAGRELDPLMKRLSQVHKIDTYYYGASGVFRDVEFKPETEYRKKAIAVAIDASTTTKSEQTGAASPDSLPSSQHDEH